MRIEDLTHAGSPFTEVIGMRNRIAVFVIALFLALVPVKLSQGVVAFTFTSIDVPGATGSHLDWKEFD